MVEQPSESTLQDSKYCREVRMHHEERRSFVFLDMIVWSVVSLYVEKSITIGSKEQCLCLCLSITSVENDAFGHSPFQFFLAYQQGSPHFCSCSVSS